MAKLYFYYAAMNAGKSTTLLQADYNYRERGMETMLWTASARRSCRRRRDRLAHRAVGAGAQLSTKVSTCSMPSPTSSSGVSSTASSSTRPNSCRRSMCSSCAKSPTSFSIPVLCYGLRTDFQGKLFPGSARAARARGFDGRVEGGVRMRPQGDDEPACRRRRSRRRGRRPDRDRRQRPLHRLVPPPFLRAICAKAKRAS